MIPRAQDARELAPIAKNKEKFFCVRGERSKSVSEPRFVIKTTIHAFWRRTAQGIRTVREI